MLTLMFCFKMYSVINREKINSHCQFSMHVQYPAEDIRKRKLKILTLGQLLIFKLLPAHRVFNNNNDMVNFNVCFC